jgi:hypothetical protein
MALNTRSAIDPRWQFHNGIVERSLAFATIEIYNPMSGESQYDPLTNSWTGTTTVLWQGKARIQPRNASTRLGHMGSVLTAIDPGASQIVEVHIGLRENQLLGSNGAMPDLRPGHRMRVTSSPGDGSLVNFEFVLRSVVNSSNPWHRMLLCEVNQELNPNNG